MKKTISILITSLLLLFFSHCTNNNGERKGESEAGNLLIGWATEDITPDRPVLIQGQFPARVSEGILDPLTVTALVLESVGETSSEKVVLVSCDIIGIRSELLAAVQNRLKDLLPEIKPEAIILNATHTHAAPYASVATDSKSIYGIELGTMSPAECLEYISENIASAVVEAWNNREPGGISYGLGHAVVGHNRLQADFDGKSLMYGNTNRPEFSHMEGFEDHTVNLLYTWDEKSNLTGVVINVPCPSQVSGSVYQISADYWHETRLEVRRRLGDNVYVLPQCGSAGDQSPHIRIYEKAESRMQKLMFPEETEIGNSTVARRKQIAVRIADAVTSVYPHVKDNIEWSPVVKHEMKVMNLSRRLISMSDVNSSIEEAKQWTKKYEELLAEIEANPKIKEKDRWYHEITQTYTRVKRGESVKERYELEKVQPKLPVQIHVARIGDIVMATNPFELYLDYGTRIKARSSATQTFIIQLSNGSYGYLPTSRSISGGAYGAVPASTQIGPEGGQELVEGTLEIIDEMMK
ncbi:MAG: hypothetical protein ACOX19_12480 [Fermentimonas sp.]